jgi:hypothetical protein
VGSGACDEVVAGLVGEAEAGHEDIVPAPACVTASPAVFESVDGEIGVGTVETGEAEWENAVEFGVLRVAFGREAGGRREG